MDKTRGSVLFGRLFPLLCGIALVGAVALWGGIIAESLWNRAKTGTDEKKSSGINWQDITPTCDGVLCDLGRAHATVREGVNRCINSRMSPDDLSIEMISAKRRLRKINAAGLDDPAVKSALLELRQQQIVLYTEMRREVAPFCRPKQAESETGPQLPTRVPAGTLDDWRQRLDAFSRSLAAFAAQASVLPDEIADKRAAAAIFGESINADKTQDQASVSAGPGAPGLNDGQGGE